jgi:hypothetical protein
MTVALTTALAIGSATRAAPVHQQESSASIDTRSPGEPILAIVSLRRQQITVYDSKGLILRAPVSSGQKGRETPAGVFSVLEKQAEHYSNLYDDAFMPHMQRLTWSGIALHGGVLPGHPASHGCIRLPFDFAESLFEVTKVGMRVIIAPGDAAPMAISQPRLFPPSHGASAEDAAKSAVMEADEAANKADQARLAALTAAREAARAPLLVRGLENKKLRADAKLVAAERAVTMAVSEDARQTAKNLQEKAEAALTDIEAQWSTAKEQAQAQIDAAERARQAAAAAEDDARAAAAKARQLARELEPISVFISRKTQRLYLRQAFEPVLDVSITIRDPDRPIGTHVLTAMDRSGENGGIEWTVVTLQTGEEEHTRAEHTAAAGSRGGEQNAQLASTNQNSLQAALDRIEIPSDTVARIAAMISPRSSIIISDEGLSSEIGRGTDFVVLLSGEPQGGIATRRRSFGSYERHGDRRGSPFRSPFFSTW